MLGHGLWRWPIINPTLVLAELPVIYYLQCVLFCNLSHEDSSSPTFPRNEDLIRMLF